MAIRNRPPPNKTAQGKHVKAHTPRQKLGTLKGGTRSAGMGGVKASRGSKGAKATAQAAPTAEAHEAEEAHEAGGVELGGMDLDPRGGGGGSGFGKQDKESILGARKSATKAGGELRRAPEEPKPNGPRVVTGFESGGKANAVTGAATDAKPTDAKPIDAKSTDAKPANSSGTDRPQTASGGVGAKPGATQEGPSLKLVSGDAAPRGRSSTGASEPKPDSPVADKASSGVRSSTSAAVKTTEGAPVGRGGSAFEADTLQGGPVLAGSAAAKTAVGDAPVAKASQQGVARAAPPLAEQAVQPVADKAFNQATTGMSKGDVGREALTVVKGDPLEPTVRKAVDAQRESDVQDVAKEDTKGVALSGGRATSKPPFADVPQGADDVEPMDTAEINAEARMSEAKNGLPLVKAGDERKPSMNAPPEIQLALGDMAGVAGAFDPSLGKDIQDTMKTGTDTDGEGEGEEEAEEEEEEADG